MENNNEFLIEKEHLKDTLSLLNKEILNYIEKRKEITQYILDYRKNAIEEYRDDEDKLIEYFDHERYMKEQAFDAIDKKLRELTILKDSPYFGKINFIDNKFNDDEEMYIGRFGVIPDGGFEPLVVDWRAPIASLFYYGSLGEAYYVAPDGKVKVDILKRRQIIAKKGELKGIFDSEVDIKDEILQEVLSSNSSEKLKDIVMTIQKEQDEIIRKDRTRNVIVNGVAGSGKTTIALHRVAYLLYNYRKELEDKVLILGPNHIFMEYISQVLPSLGESKVKQQTFLDFTAEQLEEPVEIASFEEYLESLVVGNKAIIDDTKYKNSIKIIEDLDGLVDYMNLNHFKIQSAIYFGEEVVGIDEIKEMFEKHYAYMPLFRRSEKIKRILISKIKDKRDEKFRELNQRIKELKASLKPEDLIVEENDIEFKRKIEIREIVQEVINSRKELEKWIGKDSIVKIYNEFNENKILTINDLAPILYLMIKLEGKKAKQSYKHVIIDEAQDYSPIQFKVIKELTGSKYFTIVGDINQRINKASEIPAMMDLENTLNLENIEIFNLNRSYRSTFEIIEYANRFLKETSITPLVRSGEAVEVINTKDKDLFTNGIINSINEYSKEELESIAIITKDQNQLEEVYNLIKDKIHVVKFNREDIIYKGGTVIIPSYLAKGLEFDGVIMAQVSKDSKENKEEDLIKYIMATRALHRLKDITLNL
ncbi:MAG: AAA family ATPase [Clostridium perfringens]|nr:AAA family ATPase [Clostridium perfringens]